MENVCCTSVNLSNLNKLQTLFLFNELLSISLTLTLFFSFPFSNDVHTKECCFFEFLMNLAASQYQSQAYRLLNLLFSLKVSMKRKTDRMRKWLIRANRAHVWTLLKLKPFFDCVAASHPPQKGNLILLSFLFSWLSFSFCYCGKMLWVI